MSFLKRPYLRIGFWLAVIIPGIFVFSQPTSGPVDWFMRFFSSFTYIFTLWTVNFSLVDFKQREPYKSPLEIPRIYVQIFLSFVCAIALVILLGFTLDSSRKLLSQIQREKVDSFRTWFFLCLRTSLFNSVILLIKYLFDTNQEKHQMQTENEQLKSAGLIAQHEALTQKVNPHFLFNSLNTMRSLVKRDPKLSLAFIDELCSVYRYMLHHQQEILVPLSEEIAFLSSYLYLLRIRYGAALTTEINVADQFLACRVPPNTLQLLAENAVKHNILSLNRPLRICIYESNKSLVFENNLQLKTQVQTPGGLGLNSIRSRYLLAADKDIDIIYTNDIFKVILPLIAPK